MNSPTSTTLASTDDLVLAPQGTADGGPLGLESKIALMTYTGGLIGLFSNQRMKLQTEIQSWNDKGYRLRHVLPSKPNIFQTIVQMICLCFTLTLWAPVPGETLVFERGR